MEWIIELLKEHGVNEEVIEKVKADSRNENMIPKKRFDEVNEKMKNYKKQVEELEGSSTDVEELKEKVKSLQAELQNKDAEHQESIKNMKYDSAIGKVLSNCKYSELLIDKFDRTKLSIDENGEVVGINEQYETLKEKYSDLLGSAKVNIKGVEPNKTGTVANGITKEQFDKMTYSQKVELYNENQELYDSLNNQ